MILQCLYEFAQSRQLLDGLAFKNTPVRWIINLDIEGNLIGDGVQETTSGEGNRAKSFDVPKTTRPTGSGRVADFLVDDIGAIFGLNRKPEKELSSRASKNLHLKNKDFWQHIKEASDVTGDVVFEALLKFYEILAGESPKFLRLDKTGKPKWFVRTSGGNEVSLGDDFFTFAVGELLINREDIRSYWKKKVTDELVEEAEKSQKRGVCLITGELNTPLARTHTPMVTGLPKIHKNDQIKQRGIVGFESDSFRSYGFEKSYNAPSSIKASKGYLLALQYLSSQKNHWLTLGPAWLCFWAAKTEQASKTLAQLLHKPDAKTVRSFMVSPWSGLQSPSPDSDKFYAVTLTAAGPRIIVKDWLQVSLSKAVKNFQDWFRDLEIQSIAWSSVEEDNTSTPLSIRQLARTTLLPDSRGYLDEDKLKPNLMASLYRAALEGTAPSLTLLHPILNRLRVDIARDGSKALLNHSRFALVKLILNRNRKDNIMEIAERQTADTGDVAYQCGRLLAVLAETQDKAHDYQLKGAGVVERYFGTAMASPASVFPILLKLNRHHLSKIGKSDKYENHERSLEEAIQDVLTQFNQFPRTLDLHAQGRFAIGFYQQKAADRVARDAAKQNKETNNP